MEISIFIQIILCVVSLISLSVAVTALMMAKVTEQKMKAFDALKTIVASNNRDLLASLLSIYSNHPGVTTTTVKEMLKPQVDLRVRKAQQDEPETPDQKPKVSINHIATLS